MIIYDEADEIFLQKVNHISINILNNLKMQPQKILFSATFPDEVLTSIKTFLKCQAYMIYEKDLNLKGVNLYRILVKDCKMDVIKGIYEIDMFQTMIFINKKQDAI